MTSAIRLAAPREMGTLATVRAVDRAGTSTGHVLDQIMSSVENFANATLGNATSSDEMTVETRGTRAFRPLLSNQLRGQLHDVIRAGCELDRAVFASMLRSHTFRYVDDLDSAAFRAAGLVLADLIEQGWEVRVKRRIEAARAPADQEVEEIVLVPPTLEPSAGETASDVKQRIRTSLLMLRNRQLQEPATRAFLRRVERPRAHEGKGMSIFDLIEDGSSLAEALREVLALPREDQERALAQIVRPTIEVCEPGVTCAVTGLPLIEIWRYFRHTWSLEYRPTPGRMLPLLIRNVARPRAPVIGIAMLASPAVRLAVRDAWIGWYPDGLQRRVYSGEWEAGAVGRALFDAIKASLAEIRPDNLLSSEEFDAPEERVVLRLEQIAAGANNRRLKDLRKIQSDELSRAAAESDRKLNLLPDKSPDWMGASERPLFVSKRADTLARLLRALMEFRRARLDDDAADGLHKLLLTNGGRAALATALTEIRKRALASQIADVNVCGAIAPYNELLGGKLVTLLLASSEVRQIYRDRYAGQVSEIASRLAGRPITRSAELLLLTTTSLYGVGSSQYNRLRLRRNEHKELDSDVHWIPLGTTVGFGTAHLGRPTLEALRELSRGTHGARRINNVFGEGSSPRMRQTREGLEALGVEPNEVMNHAMPRLVYGCELVPLARERLVGLPSTDEDSASDLDAIAAAWRKRWLLRRITRPGILDRVIQLGPATIKDQLVAPSEEQLELPRE